MSKHSVIHLSGHTAVLDHSHGVGGLALPAPTRDVADPFPTGALTMHEQGWGRIAQVLELMGAHLDTEDDGTALPLGTTDGGLEVLSLVVPVDGPQPPLTDVLDAMDEVMAAVSAAT